MSWVSIILWFVFHIPEMVKLIGQLIDLIKHSPLQDQLAYRNNIAKAIHTGDHELVKQVVKECVGAACPAHLAVE